MEEKIIVRSNRGSDRKIILGLAIVYIAFFLISGALYKYPFDYGDIFEDIWYVYLIVLAALVMFYFYFAKMEFVVTSKRIYGKAGFGIQVDLPMDSISSVRMGIFRNIVIGTSSGRIHFLFIDNRNEIHEEIINLLIARQQK